jgi:ribosomal protein S25
MADSAEQVNARVQEERWITVTDTADKFDISCVSAYSIIHEDLGYHKICAR